jgi:hypothetical protein
MTRAGLFALVLASAAFAIAAPVPKENDAARMVRIYGTRADPRDEAQYQMRGDALRVFLPARELPPPWDSKEEAPSPELRALWNWKPTPTDGSSRVWRDVAGDFTVVVRVSFSLRKAAARDDRWLPRVAGLAVWSGDKDHFGMIRCEERVKGVAPGQFLVRDAFQSILTHPTGMRTSNGEPGDSAGEALLRVERAGNSVRGAFSRDGKKWTDLSAEEVDWKGMVKVGVYVKHFTDAPFEATFDEYKLTVAKK